LLTLLGIAIGVASCVATSLTVEAAQRAYHDLFERVSGPAHLEIVATGQGGFAASLLEDLAATPGVRAIVPSIQAVASLSGQSGSIPLQITGVTSGVPASHLTEGNDRLDPGCDEQGILLDSGLARAEGLRIGQVVHLWAPVGPASLTLDGLLTSGNGSGNAAIPVARVTLEAAQRLFALPNQINTGRILLTEDADFVQVQSQIANRLPPGLAIQAPGARSELANATLRSAHQGLRFLSVMALVMAALIIVNTILLNLEERGRQLAILRSLGATCAQVRTLLLGEAALLGLAGSIVGLVLGLALALLLGKAMGQFLGMALPTIPWAWQPFWLALVLGPGLAMAASYIPIRQASRRHPLPSLLDQPSSKRGVKQNWLLYAGLICLGAGLMIESARRWLRLPESSENDMLIAGITGVLIGPLLMLPRALPALLRGCGRVPGPILGMEGNLALHQLQRHPNRTTFTVAVWVLALVVALGFGHLLTSILGDLQHWYRQTIVADFLVRAAMPDTSFLLASGLPESLGQEIAHLKGVETVDSLTFLPVRANGRQVLGLARTCSSPNPPPLDLVSGDPTEIRQGLLNGAVVMGVALARELGLRTGDTVTLETSNGSREFCLAGIATEYAGGGKALYLDWQTAHQALGVREVHVFLVTARPGEKAALGAALAALCSERRLLLQSREELHGLIDHLMAGVTGLLWSLMVLAFVLASMGIANTLTINVLEQAREFGILRVLGMQRGQVRRLVLGQALLMGLLTLALGIPMGIGLGYLLNCSTGPVLGKQVDFHLAPGLVSGCASLALFIGILAAVLPANRASRIQPIRSLRHS
jgi:putative ABC transport system permease protein